MTTVVIGASGFVGRNLTAQLLSQGYKVRALCRSDIPDLVKMGAEHVRFDLDSSARETLTKVLFGVEEVFLVASKVAMWGAYRDFYRTNVLGAKRVLQACQQAGVARLVYTSTPSVVAEGQDLRGVTESCPYASRYVALYPATKAAAERLILAANGYQGVQTVALRPHLIFGPGDTSLTPAVVSAASKGKLARIGRENILTDLCFIDDCVQAHILANEWLKRSTQNGGRSFFISQGDPYPFWDWVNTILSARGIAPVQKRVPFGVAYSAAFFQEVTARVTGREPTLTRFLVKELGTDHYFSIEAARKLLRFEPRYTVQEALSKTLGTEGGYALAAG
jgi:2-alkyl-3-oxoalkanoate reductase